MTDGVYGIGIQYLDSSSGMGDKPGNVCPVKSTGQLKWGLGKISDNMVQLEHFKDKHKYSRIIGRQKHPNLLLEFPGKE
jgi:hypothetical protein